MKIKHKLAAALVAAASLFCLTIPASAMSGDNGGGAGTGTSSREYTPFSILKTNDTFAWRADLYVSTNADGRINEDNDTIGGKLALVGSVLCTSPTFANYTTYIQTNYTNEMETRNKFDTKGSSIGVDSEGNFGVTQYTLPTLKEFEPSFPSYEDASGHKVAIADKTSNMELLQDQWGANNAGTDFTKVQERLTKTGYEKYIKDFLIQLLGKKEVAQDFLDNVKKSLNPELGKALVNKCGGTVTIPDIYKYLLPVNPETGEVNNECMVEWALVLTPIYRFDAVAPFYYYLPGSNSMEYVSMSTCVALDAYWFAQWDQTSHALSAAGYYSGYEGATGVDVYIGVGLLSWWLGCTESVNNAGAPGIAAYCTKEGDHYLGVYTQHENISQYKWSRWLVDKPSEYAKRGGIAVFTTKIETPEAPVYYHTYTYRIDENGKDKLPNGYTTGTYSGCLHNHIAVCFAKPTNCNNSIICVLTN